MFFVSGVVRGVEVFFVCFFYILYVFVRGSNNLSGKSYLFFYIFYEIVKVGVRFIYVFIFFEVFNMVFRI